MQRWQLKTSAFLIAAPAKRTYATPGILPAVRVGRRIRERLEGN
jgi:hypothetical protein